MGSSTEEVRAFIKQQRWRITHESLDNGLMEGGADPNKPHSGEVGASYIACDLGTTHFVMFPFETIKLGYWLFDKSGRLIEMRVDQETDAP